MPKGNLINIIRILLLVVLSACTTNPSSIPVVAIPEDANSRPVMRVLDLDALITATPTIPIPTPVPTPTRRPTPSPAQTGDQAVPSPLPTCLNRAMLVSHLTTSPNTMFHPGQSIAKIWRVKNAGTCTWTLQYALVFSGGQPMEAPMEIPLQQEVKPGEEIDLRVDMVAPANAATYIGYWMLRDEAGNLFGIGENADQPLEVAILVEIPPPTHAL